MHLSQHLERLCCQGLSERKITQKLQQLGFKISKTTIHRRLTALRKSSSGGGKYPRKYNRKLTQRCIRMLVRLVRFRGIRQTGRLQKEMAQLGHTVCCRTIRNALRSVPTIRLKRPQKQQFMTTRHMRARFQWAREMLAEQIDWSKVFFADEKVWFVDGPAFRPRVWCDTRDPPLAIHRKGTRNCAVHIWGAFSLQVVPDLAKVPVCMNSAGYCRIIQTSLLPCFSTQQHTLFHDRHPCHHSNETEAWMERNHIRARLFPPKDADINPMGEPDDETLARNQNLSQHR